MKSFRFPLDPENVSLSGDDGTQVMIKNSEGQTLYSERKALVPVLESGTDPVVLGRLRDEGKRVKGERNLAHLALVGFVALIVLGIGGGILGVNWGVDRVIDQIPVSWEESLGETVAMSMTGDEVTDLAVTEPVQKLLDKLVAAAGDQPYKMTLHIVRDPQVNAFAAPGGHIIVNTGLLEKTKRPEELAGVLGHELQHVYGRHGLRNMIHGLKWHLAAALLIGDVGSVQHMVLAKAPDFINLSYSRSLETEADLEGTKLLVKAQVDPSGLKEFFAILQEEQGQIAPPEFLSSHPDTQNRMEALEEFMAEHPERFEPLELEWEQMLEALKTQPRESTP